MSDDAIGRYEQMLAEDPKSRAFAPLAETYRKAGRLDEAIKVARTGLEVHPGYSGGLVVLGRALFEKGELDMAAEILQEAVTDTPESYLGQKFLGKVLIEKGEGRGALRALEAANFLSPEDEEVARLLDEVKSKAAVPETMEYDGKEAESTGKAQIVTYEQKPTTVDGLELPPLPPNETHDTFSFTGGGTTDPADLTPIVVVEEVVSDDKSGSEVVEADLDEEDITVTVVEEKEIEQTVEINSLDELGPEAAAFIMEGEDFDEDSIEDFSDEASFVVEEEVEEVEVVVMEHEEISSPPADPVVTPSAAEVSDAQVQPIPAPAPEPEPAPAFAPAPEPAPVPTEQTSGDEAKGEQFSTETLADLYAQQGLIEKASGIYRQILNETPDNEAVRFKLDTLSEQIPSDGESVQETQPLVEAQPEPSRKDNNEDALNVLEGMLENVERMKRP